MASHEAEDVVLAALAAVALAAAPASLRLGGQALPVAIALEVRTAGGPPPGREIAWRADPRRGLVGTTRGAEWDAEVAIAPADEGARRLEISIRWRAPAALERAALRVIWRGAARAVSGTLAPSPLVGPLRVGRGTPILVTAGGVVLAGGRGLSGARYEPLQDGRVSVELLLEDAGDRPFATLARCLERRPPRARYADLERREPIRTVLRRAGDVDAARATIYPVADAASLLPVVVERWPRGARAALVFTDHADRTDPDALRAVLWGDSARAEERASRAGFLGRGLRLTRSFFVHARRGGIDDPAACDLAAQLLDAGGEVALHSITERRDDRDAVHEGLDAAAPWRPVTWIDHDPYTNCEAISSEGWRAEGPYGVRDLLLTHGVRWVWAGDVAESDGARVPNLFTTGAPGDPHPVVFPLPDGGGLWAFRSSRLFARPAVVAAALSDDALAALERERGLAILHTYLGASPASTRRGPSRARLAVRRVGTRLVIAPEIDAALARIEARVRSGTLAVLTLAEAGDRLRALGDVEVRYRRDGTAEVRNSGAATVEGLTVALPAPGGRVEVAGAAAASTDGELPQTRLWFDLAPGERAAIRVLDGGATVPLLPFPAAPQRAARSAKTTSSWWTRAR